MHDPKPKTDDKDAIQFSPWRLLAAFLFSILFMGCVVTACVIIEDNGELALVFFALAVVFLAAAIGVLFRQGKVVMEWIIRICLGV